MANLIPKQYKNDPITIRVEKEKIKTIDKLAEKFGLSRSEFINQCIDYALANMLKNK